jgi:UDPglucose 6-dehydrogenase
LTEANFIEDFKNQDRIIIGGPRPASTKVRQLFYKAFPKAHIVKTGSITAEMVKYFTNTFLATKVSFANEMKMICDGLNIDYDKVVEYATYDERLGKSHWAVPGPDGKDGFGGSCFPKDLNALIHLAGELELCTEVLMGAWNTNLKVRPEEDWKELKGRAVVDE